MSTTSNAGSVVIPRDEVYQNDASKKPNDRQKHLLVGSLFGAFTFTLLVILMFCLYRRRKRLRFLQILPRTRDSRLTASNPQEKTIALMSSPDLEIDEKAHFRHSLPVMPLNKSLLTRPHTIHITSAQAYVPQTELDFTACEDRARNSRNPISRTNSLLLASPCMHDVDPEPATTFSHWPTMEVSGLTSSPSFASDQPLPTGSLSRASSESENLQSSNGCDANLRPQRPRPISCAADFAAPMQSESSVSPISKQSPSSCHESMLETARTSIGHGSENLNVRHNSTRSSIIWSNDVENNNYPSQRRSNARPRVHKLSFKQVHRRAFMSLSHLEVRPKVKRDKSDRNLAGPPFLGARRTKSSDPSGLHSTTREFQSVSMSSTFKSNIARSDECHNISQRNSHRLSKSVTLFPSASDPLLLVKSDSEAQGIVSPFEQWLNSNQSHRGSSHTINSLTGRRRSSLRLIGNSTADSSGQMEKSSLDTR